MGEGITEFGAGLGCGVWDFEQKVRGWSPGFVIRSGFRVGGLGATDIWQF